VQELWVSRTLNIYMSKTRDEGVLWDIPNGIRKIKHLDTSLTDMTQLTDDDISVINKKMSGSLGLLPFNAISEIPPDAQWNRVADHDSETIAKGTEVYDLTWVEKKHVRFVIFRRWRFFVDSDANLPQKIKRYKRLANDADFTLEAIMTPEYLSISQMQNVIKEFSY